VNEPIPAALILVVEDDILVQDLIQTTLQDAGYEVVTGDNGVDGMAAVERDSARLGGLVTDVNLGPGLNGWKVAACARELNANLAVVYVSGDSGHEWAAHGVPNSIMISKPFAAMEVVVALASLRNRADSSVAPS
jgi:DNA-binding response OmpR family regulator